MSENYLSIYAKSFNWAGFFLPKKIYQKCSSLYDFCRTIDDIADQELKLNIKAKQFKEFKDQFTNKDFSNQIIKNIHNIIDDFEISKKIVYDLFDGVETDLKNEVKINSKKELLIYSYRVAGTVGLMMAKILNVKKKNSLKSAIDLGIAMQLTNIARDVVEDNKKNRKYINSNFESIRSTLKTADTRNGIFLKKPGSDDIYGSVLLLADDTLRLGTQNVYNMMLLQNGSIMSAHASGATRNTAFGEDAGIALASGGNYNTLFGHGAGQSITTADQNVLIGYQAGDAIVDGGHCGTFYTTVIDLVGKVPRVVRAGKGDATLFEA